MLRFKRVLSLVLCLVMLVGMLVSCNEAQGSKGEKEDETLKFEALSDGTYAVALGDEGSSAEELIIPATYNGKSVTQIKSEAFQGATNLRTITIPDSVTSIGNYAFSGCSKLASSQFPTA